MKKLFLVLFILSTNLMNAQETSYNYSGFIELSDASKIPYQLKFNVQNDSILGYSISDSFGIDETKSTVIGTIDSGVFLINEVDIMSSKAAVLNSEFCLLHMNLNLVENEEVRYLKGEFNGFYTDSVPCVSGQILLVDSLSFVKSIITEQPIKKKEKNKELSVRTLSVESSLSFQTSKNSITLLLWDDGIVDGDEVSVFSNDQAILMNYKVKRRKKKLLIPLKDGLNVVTVNAFNVGLYSPNTTRIQIVGVGKKFEAVTYLDQGESATIKIKRKLN